AVDVAVVGHGHSLLPNVSNARDQFLHVASAVEQRIIGMQVQMNEFRHVWACLSLYLFHSLPDPVYPCVTVWKNRHLTLALLCARSNYLRLSLQFHRSGTETRRNADQCWPLFGLQRQPHHALHLCHALYHCHPDGLRGSNATEEEWRDPGNAGCDHAASGSSHENLIP